jgi:hypothetical protein
MDTQATRAQAFLPPPNTDPEGIAMYVDNLVRESEADPRRERWLATAERNLNLYAGKHWITATPEGEIRLTLNRTQNAIVSLVSLQAGDPPKITFTPRETDEPTLTFLNTQLPEAKNVMLGLKIDPATGVGGVNPDTGEPLDVTQPLPQATADMLKQQFEVQRALSAQDSQQGLPPTTVPPPEDLLVEVSDSTASQALQTIFDAMWDEADGQVTFTENVMNKNILGWQPTLVEFDDEEKRHILTNVHPKMVHPDPLSPDSTRWAYCVFDQPIGTYEAARKYPHIAAKIIDAGRLSVVTTGSFNYDIASLYADQEFRRDMVVIRTAWIRHQPYQLSREQALAAGKLQEVQVPTGEQEEALDSLGNVVGMKDTTRPVVAFPGETDEAQPIIPHPDKPGETTKNPQWPTRYSTRQITIIAGVAVVDDRECEYDGIPLVVNKNIPIPFSTYGQGEPERLEGLQMAVNRLLSSFVTHHAYNAYPPEMVPESVLEMMDEALKKCRTKPGQRIAIPDSVLLQLGDMNKVVQNMEVSQMPSDFWKLLDLLVQYIDMEGNQADVIQGDAAAGWSGKTVESLQGAANQVIRGKAIYTEFYLKNLARLMVYAIINRLQPSDWKRYVSRYPLQAIQAFHDRTKKLDVDVAVEIASGSGASRMTEINNLMAARTAMIPVSDPTVMEKMGLDPEAELQHQADWEKKRAALQGPMPSPGENPGNKSAGTPSPDKQNKERDPQPAGRVPSSGGGPASNNAGNGGGQ